MGYRNKDGGLMLVMHVFKHFVILTCSPFSLFFCIWSSKRLCRAPLYALIVVHIAQNG
jgi:hypothetical protein